jgi:hypothetical protein
MARLVMPCVVAALSTTLSTAALDKHPQSKERGITLDLGFSCFHVGDLPAAAVGVQHSAAAHNHSQQRPTSIHPQQPGSSTYSAEPVFSASTPP